MPRPENYFTNLTAMHSTSVITISRSAIKANLDALRQMIGPTVRISSVVKANAYGHGIDVYPPLAEEMGIDHFSVFSFEEAAAVKQAVKNADVCIMGMVEDSQIPEAVEKGIEMFVFDRYRLGIILETAKRLKTPAKVHIETETGMHRTGLEKKNVINVIEVLQQNSEHLVFKGLCTHLAGPESISNHVRVNKQVTHFQSIKRLFKKHNLFPEYTHIANSAGSVNYPHIKFNMVRVGILQYGFWPSKETFIRHYTLKKTYTDPLKRAISWKTRVMSIKEVDTGEFVGYGNFYLTGSPMRVAILPIGYSNGYSRDFSNKGRVLIHNSRCSVIGLVNMNMIAADITGIGEVRIGDEAVIIGKQGDLEISVSYFGTGSDRINYEVLSRLPAGIPRLVVD